MKYFLLTILLLGSITLCSYPLTSRAQGGIGIKPRDDIVMLRATVRDSLSDEIFARIMDLKHYAEIDLLDSAAMIIAYNGIPDKSSKWGRAVDIKNPVEKERVDRLLDKIKKLFSELPETHKEYYAVFKDKDNPSGQKHLYQITFSSGKKKRMVSWTFYPVGDKLMLGDVS